MQKLIILAIMISACGPAVSKSGQLSDDPTALMTDSPDLSALFHPVDPTLEKIAELVKGPYSRIDIAMYNMESTSKSPVVAALASAKVQQRIKSGKLKIRVMRRQVAKATRAFCPPDNAPIRCFMSASENCSIPKNLVINLRG